MPEEKEYKFYESTSATASIEKIVKESELTEPQKDLLLGQAIYDYDKLPEEIQNKFILYILGT